MKRRITLIVLAVLGVVTGTAFAAFVSSTSTGVNTFTTRAVASKPVITNTRITTDPTCAAGAPAETVRQGETFYVCAQSITDPAGVATATADLEAISGDAEIPLFTTGGPFSGYAYRSDAKTAFSPLSTGTSGGWSIRATNMNGDRTTESGLTYNIRSYSGMILGEFGAPAEGLASQYYRFAETTTSGANLGTGGNAAATYNGTPTRRVPGAIVGSGDTAVRLNGGSDYLSATRRAAIASNYAVEIWVKGTATSGLGPGTLWSDSAGLIDAGNAANNNDFGVAVDATGRIVAGCGNAAVSTIRSAAGVLADGLWHHVVFNRVRTTGAITLYVDGVQVAAATTCNTTAHTGSTTVWFGRSHESTLNLTADLDEPVLWGRNLTSAEVLDHFRLGTGT
ncbi:MAG: LamG domain-containing protein [Solirubrobacteraceae bacterium]|nr:LamG domain-containing protein [Solirubrobacteraceae bacterium]